MKQVIYSLKSLLTSSVLVLASKTFSRHLSNSQSYRPYSARPERNLSILGYSNGLLSYLEHLKKFMRKLARNGRCMHKNAGTI